MSQLFLSETAACMPMFYVALLCHNWNDYKITKVYNNGKKKDFPQVMVMVWILQQTHIKIHEYKNNKKIILQTSKTTYAWLPCPPPPPRFAFFVLGGLFPTPGINAERDNSPPRGPDRPHKTCFWGTSFWKQNWFLHNSKTKCIQSFYKCVLELI